MRGLASTGKSSATGSADTRIGKTSTHKIERTGMPCAIGSTRSWDNTSQSLKSIPDKPNRLPEWKPRLLLPALHESGLSCAAGEEFRR